MATVVFTRGGLPESVHDVAWCATAADGEVIASSDSNAPALGVFARSALKPLQALPAVRAGVLDAMGLGAPHLALACASHGGRREHLDVAREVLAAAGLSAEDLGCGPLEARDPQVVAEMRRDGLQPTRLHHNCSGKHALGLALCVNEGWPTASYMDAEHPLQRAMHAAVADATGLAQEQVPYGADGCGMLAFSVSLASLAAAFAHLDTAVADAMREYPHLVAYEGALDTELMRAEPGLVAKVGAEGVLAVALPDGRGLAIKVLDGAMRALDPAGVALVREILGCEAGGERLEALARPRVVNSRGDVVGEGEARL
jgi:L-asparaginase II